MTFNWIEYLDLARLICEQRANYVNLSSEALCRCAVSRAYYAAFCYARKRASEHWGFVRRGPEDHRELPNFLRDRKAMPATASALKRIQEWRTNCDYDDELHPNVNASYAIHESQRVIDDVTERLQMESRR